MGEPALEMFIVQKTSADGSSGPSQLPKSQHIVGENTVREGKTDEHNQEQEPVVGEEHADFELSPEVFDSPANVRSGAKRPRADVSTEG